NSPMSIDGLGLAYTVKTTVAAVEPNSPAAKAGLQLDDVIKAIQFYDSSRTGKNEALGWNELEREQGAQALWIAHEDMDTRQLGLRVTRANGEALEVILDGEPDTDWPVPDRGLAFDFDTRLQKADNLAQALVMGTRRTG